MDGYLICLTKAFATVIGRMQRARVAMLAAFMLVVGCGGGGSDGAAATNPNCDLTITGALEGANTCFIHWHYNSAFYIGMTSGAPNTESPGMVFDIYGIEPKLGTYTSADANDTVGFVSAGGRRWRVSKNHGQDANVGSYSTTVTGVSDKGNSGSVHFWDIDGTLDIIYEADPKTPNATGQVSVHVVF